MLRQMRTFWALAMVAIFIIAGFNPALSQNKDDPVVAVVNGYKLFQSDVDQARQFLPPQTRQQFPEHVINNFIIRSMIDSRVIADAARAQGIDKESVVGRRLSRIADQVLQQVMIDRRVEVELSDEKLKVRYDEFIKQNPPQDEVWARHILVETEEQANEAIRRLEKGEGFQKLAREISTGPSGKNGGDLGYFTRERMVPAFSTAAFDTEPGTFTKKPVKSQFGWHVIKVEERRSLAAPSFEETRDQLRSSAQQGIVEAYTEELRAKAKIERNDAPAPAPAIIPAPAGR